MAFASATEWNCLYDMRNDINVVFNPLANIEIGVFIAVLLNGVFRAKLFLYDMLGMHAGGRRVASVDAVR